VRGVRIAVAVAALATVAACKKTGEGEYQVQTPDVNVSTDTHTVRTPSVEMGKDTTVIERPTVGTTKDTIITPKVKVKPPQE
jgi:hypothetical protein